MQAVDIARGLALFGMFIAHVAPAADGIPVVEQLVAFSDERPRILFALVAGMGLGFISGGVTPLTADRGRVRGQVAIRAVLIFALGALLISLQPLVIVILEVYGLAFLLMIPLIFVRAEILLVVGCVLVAVMPAFTWAATAAFRVLPPDAQGWRIPLDWLLTGAYPLVIWVPVMMIGLALVRLDLAAVRTVVWMSAAGVVGIVTGLIAWQLAGNAGDPLLAESAFTVMNVSVAVAIVAALLALTGLAPTGARRVARAVFWPVAAVGAMPLTIYTAHILVLVVSKRQEAGVTTDDSWGLTIGLIVGSLLFASLWRRLVGRGPLEWVVAKASMRG
ncbi:DUF418 domain-containing protein [Compostimonas suwonensis]|uniref:DUF418 domain-containing protein n=1 Tax=Compostimonas suwonensis TaxID=1048394 RepID=UPI0012FDA5C8|nr:DUF418 domain-containing protein [Compostimonas suwonensis]